MATIFTRPNSQHYYAAFRIEVRNSNGQKAWKQFKQVTKIRVPQTRREQEKSEQEALRVAMEFEQNALREAGAGTEGSQRILSILREAGDKAAQKRLTAAMGKDYIRKLVEASTGEKMPAERTITGWLNEWLEMKKTGIKPATLSRYKASVKALLAYLGKDEVLMPLDSLTIGKLRMFRDKLKAEGRTAKTTNHYLKDLSSALAAAVKEGHLQRSPGENLELLPEEDSMDREPLTFADIARLLEAAPSDDWRGVILLGAFGGLRLGDAAGITRACIDLEDRVIRFKPQKTQRKKEGKKAPVQLPMHTELIRYFENIELPGDLESPVFPTLARVSISGNNGLSSRFVRIMETAGVSRGQTREHIDGKAGRSAHSFSFHSLRHTFNSSMFNGGVTQEMRMKIVGHADAKTNARYTHAEMAALRKAVDAVPVLEIKKTS